MSTAHRLNPFPGINTDCLGHYLMGLGLLRAVSTAWPSARGCWHDGIFWLAGDFEEKEINTFLTSKWKPTPYTKWWTTDQKADTVLKQRKKQQIHIHRARARCPQPDIRTLDCTIVPCQSNQFNPIFGTGGNIGKRDLATAHEDAIELCKKPNSAGWLDITLYGKETTEAPPFTNGGTWFVYNNKTFNSGLDWSREGSLSPWSFLLAMEGALLLRGGGSKRLGSRARPYAVFPFISQPIDPDGRDEVTQIS